MKPYYEHAGVTIYHGDARDVLPLLGPVDAIITDPVWPNAIASLAGSDDPYGLLADAARHFPRLAKRAVIQLGCNSDPRFLAAMPTEMPFFRVCWLEYVLPGYQGRLMNTGDVAYVFGRPIPSEAGARVIPGRFTQTASDKNEQGHPCARRLAHVRWLVRWFARGTVLDPFMGSGTTLLAAKYAGLSAVGIEISREFCDRAVERLEAQDVLPLEACT